MPFKQTGKNLFQVQKDFAAFQRRYPTFVGTIAVDFFKGSFRRQGFVDDGLERWKPRAKTPTDRRSRKKGKTLVRTGRLRRSIRITRKGSNYVVVGTDVPYARTHNEGGQVKASVTVGRHRRKAHSRNGVRVPETTVRTHKRNVNFNMPKRQFMGNSKFLNRRITLRTAARITNLF